MAPTKTLYVKEKDMPLWERFEKAVNDWNAADSVSALIAEAMRGYLDQYGDQGGGLYVSAPDEELQTFGDGMTAILDRHGPGWKLCLDPDVFGDDAYSPYELSSRDLPGAITEARQHMVRERAQGEIAAAARRLREARGEEEIAQEREGRDAGRRWALNDAMPSELQAVLELSNSWWISIEPDGREWPTLYTALSESIDSAPDEPWVISRDPFMVAFFDAAAEVYSEVLSTEKEN